MTSFGEKLRNHRENSGLTLSEISESTKIRKAYLEALESNDFGALPGGVFAKGYIRSYAEALGTNPEPLLDAYEKERQARGHGDADGDDRAAQDAAQAALSRLARSDDAPARDNRRRVLFGTLGVIGVALVVAVAWFVLRDPGHRAVDPGPPAEAATTESVRERAPALPPGTKAEEKTAQQRPGQAKEEAPAKEEVRPAMEQPAPPKVEETEPVPSNEQPADSHGLRVTESGVGTGVVDHRLVGQSDRFSEGTRVWFWTRVVNGNPGQMIEHVWLRDGADTGSTELRLGGKHWRTQSNRMMRPGSAGPWTVEARAADGRVLAKARFVCVAAR